jgi:glutamine synthetase type III
LLMLSGLVSHAVCSFHAVGLVFPIPVGLEDRNRTAPFPFCGNRFEVRTHMT